MEFHRRLGCPFPRDPPLSAGVVAARLVGKREGAGQDQREMIIALRINHRGLKPRDSPRGDQSEPMLGEAPTVQRHAAGYGYDGKVLRCPGKCGILDMLF